VSANNPAAAPAKEKASSKKLIVIGAIVALLVVIGGAAAWFMMSRHGGDEEEGAAPRKAAAAKGAPPTFLALENMVVNLADPGGDRFAQVGITLELEDAKTAEQVKQYLPAIRSGILMLISQRSAQELLAREGKEKLANDILREVSRPLGYSVPKKRKPVQDETDEDAEDPPARSRQSQNPVRQVLFSSFIIQ
jgi:flagellar FliL protein